MKKMRLSISILTMALLGTGANLNAQVSGDHAFMIGDYVEIGIHEAGYEGAPLDSAIATHYRGVTGKLGFVANPAADGWVEYNGDFYQPGSPESGFGIGFTRAGVDYDYSNNAVGLFEIPGEITSYYSTVDSIIVDWEGMPPGDSLLVKLKYTLKKDEHFYRTFIEFDNIGSETYSDVYYFRTLDPDNNQTIGWSYVTENHIVSQSEMADDSAIVSATQDDAWTAIMLLEAYGPEWKAYTGGFANRDASAMWDGTGGLTTTEGYNAMADQAIGITLKVASLPPGKKKVESEVYSFATAFKTGIAYEDDPVETDGLNEHDIDFNLYPNPNAGDIVDLQITGEFVYSIVDMKGSLVLAGQGNGYTQIDLKSIEKGIYIINIQQNGASATEKLIIR
jgi:hypothetical protein